MSQPAPPSMLSSRPLSLTLMLSLPARAVILSAPPSALIWLSPSLPTSVSSPMVPTTSRSTKVDAVSVPPMARLAARYQLPPLSCASNASHSMPLSVSVPNATLLAPTWLRRSVTVQMPVLELACTLSSAEPPALSVQPVVASPLNSSPDIDTWPTRYKAVSIPAPPSTVSLPPCPSITSSPLPPVKRSAISVPVKVVMLSALNELF